MKTHTVSFPDSPFAKLSLKDDTLLAEVLTTQNSPVLFGCRTGVCGTCLVEVLSNNITPPSNDERELLDILAPDNSCARLACQIALTCNIEIRTLQLMT